MLHSVSLDANPGHLFSMYLAGQKAISGLEKAQTKEGVLSAKGLDGAFIYCSCQLGSGQVLYRADLSL